MVDMDQRDVKKKGKEEYHRNTFFHIFGSVF